MQSQSAWQKRYVAFRFKMVDVTWRPRPDDMTTMMRSVRDHFGSEMSAPFGACL